MMMHLLLWLWLLALSAVTAWSYWLAPDGSITSNWQGVVYVLAPITAAIAGLGAVRQFGLRVPQGKALFALVLGVIGWCIGEVLWTYYDLIAHIDPYPSPADAFYLLAYVAFSVGLLYEIQFLRSQVRIQNPGTQQFLLITIGVLLMILAGYFGVYHAYKPGADLLENFLAITYGVADVVLIMFGLVIAVVASELRGGKMAKPWWWLLAGFTFIFLADIGFAMFTQQYETQLAYYKPALDSLWIAGYLAIAYGLQHHAWLIHSVQQYLTDAASRELLQQAKPVQSQRNRRKRK